MRGRYNKYSVVHARTGMALPEGSHFVLVPGKDAAARIAVAAYAEATDDLALAADLRSWLQDLRVEGASAVLGEAGATRPARHAGRPEAG